MRPELIEFPELRRDLGDRPGLPPSKPRRRATAEQIALRAVPASEGFVTSPDRGGRRRLLMAFGLASLGRSAS
jgi:hypothetical protein